MNVFSMAYMESAASKTKYTIGDTEFERVFFLADGIYPNEAYVIKINSQPTNPKEKLLAKQQEGCRGDVDRAFGMLLSKWHILDVATWT